MVTSGKASAWSRTSLHMKVNTPSLTVVVTTTRHVAQMVSSHRCVAGGRNESSAVVKKCVSAHPK